MDYKQMCVQQGYVPSTCTMEGQMCWALVQSQGDPCKGCMANRKTCNGRHAPYENDTYKMMSFLDWLSDADKRRMDEDRKRREKLIEQRREGHIDGFTRVILEVNWERSPRSSFEIIVKDCVNERAYIKRCDNIPDATSIAHQACCKYDVEQIHVETNGCGAIYDALKREIRNVDIVPFHYVSMNLS
ncbi:hypothetical protein SDC9_46800 [bioreactor metagenome]|uniref:Uncharacterized protein n=1 Tax=bioreactor metagenome TaxID=1076179 RepID=A0A644WDC8_9ZZZZ